VARTQLKGTFRKELEGILTRRTRQSSPDNYVLITDVPLTGEDRDNIETLAHEAGFSGNLGIINGTEVCEFLDLFPQVRRSYPNYLALLISITS